MRAACQPFAAKAFRSPICSAQYRALSRPRHATNFPRATRQRSDNRSSDQAQTTDDYYEKRMDAPLKDVQPATSTAPAPPPPEELPKTDREERLAKARVVFGSRLAGPAERRDQLDRESQLIAGVKVPPKPDEPDNCCMSGCVNCVWDRYRDEIEEWASASAEARANLQSQRTAGQASGSMLERPGMPTHVATSMDDDGGGSETNWSAGEDGPVDLFENVPIGIREFMRTEKMLKERHIQQKTVDG